MGIAHCEIEFRGESQWELSFLLHDLKLLAFSITCT